MNTFLSLCQTRASVRKYSSRPLNEADLNYVMECVRLAPSAVNRQPWRIYYVESPLILTALHKSYAREWIQSAPAAFVLCKIEDEQWVRPADGHAHGDIDLAIATEHLCLAATERGLGTCWVCNFDEALCRTALQLPEQETPIVIVPIGYAADDFTDAGRKRKPLDEIFLRR